MTDPRAPIHPDTLLVVAAGLEIVPISADEVLVQYGTRSRPSELLRDSDLTGILATIADRLRRGPATVAELLTTVAPAHHGDAHAAIADLLEHGILTDSRRDPVDQYLRYMFEGEPHVPKARVTLFGAGPLGARFAHTLLQHGIGTLTLLDGRTADDIWYRFMPPGLARPSGPRDRPASGVLADALRQVGFSNVECAVPSDSEGIEPTVRSADLVVVATEGADIRLAHLVNRHCLRERKTWLHVSIDGNLGLVGPLFIPGQTGCYNEYRTLIDAGASAAMARRHRQHLLAREASSFFAGLPAYVEIVAGHACLAAVHFLLRETSFALGRVMVVDFDQMRIDTEDLLKLPRCPVCSTLRSPYRPPFGADDGDSVGSQPRARRSE